MDKKIKIISIVSFIHKSHFGNKNYYGYSKHKYLGIIKIITNKKINGYGETLVGVYSPKLFKINLEYIAKFIVKKDINQIFQIFKNLKQNKFFFDNGILKSIISGLEIAVVDIISQTEKCGHAQALQNILKIKNKIQNFVPVYASAGSIISNIKEFREDINNAKNLNINCFKARIALNKPYDQKINLLRDFFPYYAIDLISNTYDDNNNLPQINNFISFLSNGKKPVWLEEILKTDQLSNFFKINRKKLKFSYGENFNSINDFYNLIEFYKFNYINPDLSHFSFIELNHFCEYLSKKNLSKKVIVHCWGGAINLFFSLAFASILNNQIQYVEFPITQSNFLDKLIQKTTIKKSLCSIDQNIKSFSEVIDIEKLEEINISRLTFNF